MAVDTLIEEIKKLSVTELADLVKALEEEFGVSAAAPMMVAGPAAAGAPAEAGAAAEEKTEFTPMLAAVGDKKIQVIKVVRALTGLGLKEAKDVVDNAPKPIKENVSQEEANDIKAKLEEVGATVEIQ